MKQDYFDYYIRSIVKNKLNTDQLIFTYLFIQCIEYSQKLILKNRYPKSLELFMSRFHVDRSPINDPVVMNNRIIRPVYSNDSFLKFDFKHLYQSNQRNELFGERSENDAWKYYIESGQYNRELMNTMKSVSSLKIGDIVNGINAYHELRNKTHKECIGSRSIINAFSDFDGWLLDDLHLKHDDKILDESINGLDNLNIIDFYTIIPDNPSLEDLIQVYEPHIEHIKRRSCAIYKGTYDKSIANVIYNKYLQKGLHVNSSNIRRDILLLAIMTKNEFEQLIWDNFLWKLGPMNRQFYTNIDSFKSQCTIENMIRIFNEAINDKYSDQYNDDWWVYKLMNNQFDKLVFTMRYDNLSNDFETTLQVL